MRRTKIVCTIGPASDSVEILKEMMLAGMNVARLNFSHGTHEEHARRVENIRRAAQEVGKNIALMLDTKGPEIRTGPVREGQVMLEAGQRIVLTGREVPGDAREVSVTYPDLARQLRPGQRILIADGVIELKVEDTQDQDIICRVVAGGPLGSHKNLHVPGVSLDLPALTEKDIADINFAIEHKFDFIAASFVRRAADVLAIRRVLEERGVNIAIIAKIENHEGVEKIDEILKVASGIMVARGDLGVDLPPEEVPLIQKKIIEKCNRAGKPVITATQMLESMINNPRPTRAEAADVANAILDGTDAVMLSGETAAGKYPVEAVKTMARIAARAEEALTYLRTYPPEKDGSKTVTDAISHAVCTAAAELKAAAIITSTKSGYTARMVSKYRPRAPIVAVTPSMEVVRRLALVWGVQPLLVKETSGTDEMIAAAIKVALSAGFIKAGDLVVITAGVPVGVPGTTNLLKVHVVGDILARGQGIGSRAVTGRIRIARTPKEAREKLQEGEILVTEATDRDFMPVLERAAAIITETGGLTSHAAIVGLELGIPVIVGVDGATSILPDGEIVTVDGARGIIYRGVSRVL